MGCEHIRGARGERGATEEDGEGEPRELVKSDRPAHEHREHQVHGQSRRREDPSPPGGIALVDPPTEEVEGHAPGAEDEGSQGEGPDHERVVLSVGRGQAEDEAHEGVHEGRGHGAMRRRMDGPRQSAIRRATAGRNLAA